MTSISIDFWYQSILIGGLNRLISIISIDFWYWFLLINYVWKDVRLWGCAGLRDCKCVRLWSCEAEWFSGFETDRLWVCIVRLWCCVRLRGCQAVRLWDCETMIWDYDMMLLGFESLGGVAFSLIPSFTFPSFKNSQITLDNLAWSAIRRDLTS